MPDPLPFPSLADPSRAAVNEADDRTRIRVLLVEDEDAHAELIRRAFEPHARRMTLSIASSLERARARLAEEPPDLALIDLLLPDGRGTELLPSLETEVDFPIIIMTSHGDEAVAVEAMKAGALNYVVKSPETFTDLPQIVEGALREWGHVVERRRAEAALQASERHFRSLIENALDIITVLDAGNRVRYASPAIERVLGYAPGERVGTDFFELVHPEDREPLAAAVEEVLTRPGATRALEYRYRHQDGSLRVLEAVASTHLGSDGARQTVINSRDVTDRRQAEEEKRRLEDQLRHSQKWEVIGSLAGGIANEFNNMLTPILGFASLALEEATPGSKSRRWLEHVLTAATRSKELAERLLLFSHQNEPQRQRLRLAHLVDEALELLRPSLVPRIEVRKRVDPDDDAIVGDPDQIHQVLVSLCTNAYHAMPDGGVLEVEVEGVDAERVPARARSPEGRYVRLSVRDTGQGMDPATRDRVLEPFFTTKAGGESPGLGLSVTHGIVVGHGGELVVESAPGEGTTVHVYLPRAELPEERPAGAVAWDG